MLIHVCLFLLLPFVPDFVSGDVNWGDCNSVQQNLLREGLQGAWEMAFQAESRLRQLHSFVGRIPPPNILLQRDDIIASTYRTYSRFVDYSLWTTQNQTGPARQRALRRLGDKLQLSLSLKENIEAVLLKEKGYLRLPRIAPPINFFCSVKWIGLPARAHDEEGNLMFKDERSAAEGGWPEHLGALFPLPRTIKMVSLRECPVNNMPGKYSSLISMDNLWLYSNHISLFGWAISNERRDFLLKNYHNPQSIKARAGEGEYVLMRRDRNMMPRTWSLDRLLNFHLNGALNTLLAGTDSMATAPWNGKNYKIGNYTDRCDHPSSDSNTSPRHREKPWECIFYMAKNSPDNATDSPLTHQLLTTALYLDNWDWSSGLNVPLKEVRTNWHHLEDTNRKMFAQTSAIPQGTKRQRTDDNTQEGKRQRIDSNS